MKKYFYESVLVCAALVLTAAILVYLVVSANHVETVPVAVSESAAQDSSDMAGTSVEKGNTAVIGTTTTVAFSSSSATTQAVTAAIGKINVNTATIEELKTLDGIGDVLAKNIVDYRRTYGPFTKPEDLLEVSGIGEGKLKNIRDSICFE